MAAQLLRLGLQRAIGGVHGGQGLQLLASLQQPTATSLTSTLNQHFSTHLSTQQAMQLANALSIPAKSLAFERAPIQLPPALDNKMGHFLLDMLGFYSNKSQMLHGGQALYEAIKEQCDSGAMQKAFNLDPTFYSTYTLLALHVWLVIHRLASQSDRQSKEFKQRFYGNFQSDVERRVHQAGVQVGVRKWLKKLETVFFSSGMAFDKVLSGESKETFTEVVLAHYFGGDVTKKAQAALVAKYLQRELHCLQLTEQEAIFRGNIRFSQEPFEPFLAAVAKEEAEKKGGKTGPSQAR